MSTVQAVIDEMLSAFEAGRVPAALAQILLPRTGDSPCQGWSLRNRLIAALRGHFDARGYRQWLHVGRHVRRGEKAFFILAPRLRRRAAEDQDEDESDPEHEENQRLVGFLAVPVFGYAQTEGEPLPADAGHAAFLDSRPLIEVARSWGVQVVTFSSAGTGRLGAYCPSGKLIALAVENLSTWAHELVHAADDRLGTLGARAGQQLDAEVVAEFGGAVLLECLGYPVESDRGGGFAYIKTYCDRAGKPVLPVCLGLCERVRACVSLLLETAANLHLPGPASLPAPPPGEPAAAPQTP